MNRLSSFLAASLLVLASTAFMPATLAAGQDGTCSLPNSDTTPPFTDRCYHQGVWFSPDTSEVDILILPPQSVYELREWQLLEQAVANWEAGIQALGASWLTSGLHINDYTVGHEYVPPAVLDDPEVVIAIHSNLLPLGAYAGAAIQSPGICHGLDLLQNIGQDVHNHAGSPYGSFMLACNGGGRLCVVTDAATLGLPTGNDRRINFDLVSHEIGHCLTLGHVGDANTESTDDSLAYPEHDIMSYENDGLHASTMHCPSNLNVRTIEKAYGSLLGQSGATTAVAPAADAYVHMDPDDWTTHACHQSTANYADVGYLASADPLGLSNDSDGDGTVDGFDSCAGHDDADDIDDDNLPDGCDDDDNDGPAGDEDGDGVDNANDACPGLDDASSACVGLTGTTYYLGRGKLATPSGNLDVLAGDTSVLQHTLTLNSSAPTNSVPSVIFAPGHDGTAHDPVRDPAEWSTPGLVTLSNQDVQVVWWGLQPASGLTIQEKWDVKLYFGGAATPAATGSVTATGTLDGQTPTKYTVTLTGVSGTGRLSVMIDPAAVVTQQDFLILYDSPAYASRLVVGPA